MNRKLAPKMHHQSLVIFLVFIIGSYRFCYAYKNSEPKVKEIITYYENGTIREKYQVLINSDSAVIKDKNGYPKKHGKYISNYSDGSTEDEEYYKAGSKIGIHKSFCSNGTKYFEGHFNNNGNDTIIRWNCQGQKKETVIYKNGKTYKLLKYDTSGIIINYDKDGILLHPIINAYLGYPLIINGRFGVNLELPSKNEHINAYPFNLFLFADPGISGFQSGLGISKDLSIYPRKISIQGAVHYSWYEIDWNNLPHIPRKTLYAGTSMELSGWVLSIKAGPYFKIYGDSDNKYFFSIELGFDILEFKNTFLMGGG